MLLRDLTIDLDAVRQMILDADDNAEMDFEKDAIFLFRRKVRDDGLDTDVTEDELDLLNCLVEDLPWN